MSDCRFGVSPVNYPDPDPHTSNMINNKITFSCIVRQIIMTVNSNFNVFLANDI